MFFGLGFFFVEVVTGRLFLCAVSDSICGRDVALVMELTDSVSDMFKFYGRTAKLT